MPVVLLIIINIFFIHFVITQKKKTYSTTKTDIKKDRRIRQLAITVIVVTGLFIFCATFQYAIFNYEIANGWNHVVGSIEAFSLDHLKPVWLLFPFYNCYSGYS